MEQFNLLNSIPDGDAQQLLSDTIAKAASSAVLAAVRSVLSDGKPKKKGGRHPQIFQPGAEFHVR